MVAADTGADAFEKRGCSKLEPQSNEPGDSIHALLIKLNKMKFI